jgi:hypothetical protein
MTNSLVLFALSGALAAATTETPAWHTDYGRARQLGRATGRPLVVVVGSGQEGWGQLSKDGKLGQEVNRLLAANYVCVYVNAAETKGQTLAAALEITGPGLVISDRSGEVQALHHQGSLPETTLAEQLRRHADPTRVVQHTESNAAQRVSRYYSPGQPSPTFAPATYAPRAVSVRGC